MKRLSLAIDSDLGNVALLAVAVNRVCLHLGFDNVLAGHVELCIAEAATNAIRHAYHGAPGHTVAITLAADRDQLLLEVSDTGTPMAVEQQERLLFGSPDSEDLLTDVHSLPEGGRGLLIIHDLMDTVSYITENGHNQLNMAKKLSSTTRAPGPQ